jgi:hypothetical protein
MSLKCPICGREYLHDRKICQTCEETAINSSVSHSGRDVKKWRCDNFLELKSLPFGCNLDSGKEVGPKMIECPECGVEYSYGRKISHTCNNNSVTFGKIFELEHRGHKWNCDTAMTCMELLASDIDSAETIVGVTSRFEKLETNDYKWNDLKLNIEIDVKRNHLIYE